MTDSLQLANVVAQREYDAQLLPGLHGRPDFAELLPRNVIHDDVLLVPALHDASDTRNRNSSLLVDELEGEGFRGLIKAEGLRGIVSIVFAVLGGLRNRSARNTADGTRT